MRYSIVAYPYAKEYLRDTKEFKEFNRWVEAHFGGNNK